MNNGQPVNQLGQCDHHIARCCECGIEEKGSVFLFERQGKFYCEAHLLNTPSKLAYEKWFVDPQS